MITTVVFDAGCTLIDECHYWQQWADVYGVSYMELFAAVGAVIENRQHHRQAFTRLFPDMDHDAIRETLAREGRTPRFYPDDFYPDARACIEALKSTGRKVIVAGNYSKGAESMMRDAFPEVDLVTSSESFEVEKPDPRFFQRVVELAGETPEHIAYVGDRLDNDVLPAQAAGMTAVFLPRGAWGILHQTWPEAAEVKHRIESLEPLADLIAGL